MATDTAPLTAEEEAEVRTYYTSSAHTSGPRHGTDNDDVCRFLATLDHERELRAEAVRSFAERVRREVEALPCYRPGCSCEDGPPLRSRVLALMGTESSGGSDLGSEYGRLLAERDRLVADGADPAELVVPLSPLAETTDDR